MMAALALPMIVSNISVPLVGLVDTAIVGHLPDSFNLAGVSLGAIVITQMVWICGFLRMSATGFSAQACGAKDSTKSAQVLLHGMLAAITIALIIIPCQSLIFDFARDLSAPTSATLAVASEYFTVRVNFIFVSFINLVLVGWMIGQHLHTQVMVIQLIANVCNIALSLVLALTLDMGVTGVVVATVVSETLACCLSLILIQQRFPGLLDAYRWETGHIKTMLGANQHMLVRNLILQICLAIITFSGIRMGELTAATNAVLMQYFVLIALGLDGIAYSAEALVGKAAGAKNVALLRRWLVISAVWSLLVACFYSGVFYVGFGAIGNLITNLPDVQENMARFQWYIVLLPLLGHWCFLMDGIYIGLMKARAMRDTMLLSGLLVFLPVWWFLIDWHNHGLWLSFLVFLSARGAVQGIYLYVMNKRNFDLKIE